MSYSDTKKIICFRKCDVGDKPVLKKALKHVVRKSDRENIISGFLAAGSGAELRAECECCVILT